MKGLLFILLSAVALTEIHGQKNRFEVGLGIHNFVNQPYPIADAFPYTQQRNSYLRVEFSRSFCNHYSAFVRYSRASIFMNSIIYTDATTLVPENVGKIEHRRSYNYFDLGLRWQLLSYKAHSLALGLSTSLAYGTNVYLTKVILGPPGGPYDHTMYLEMENRKAAYFGGTAEARYDFTFWKKRVNIGPDFALRYYFGDFPFQINYGLHAGFNF